MVDEPWLVNTNKDRGGGTEVGYKLWRKEGSGYITTNSNEFNNSEQYLDTSYNPFPQQQQATRIGYRKLEAGSRKLDTVYSLYKGGYRTSKRIRKRIQGDKGEQTSSHVGPKLLVYGIHDLNMYRVSHHHSTRLVVHVLSPTQAIGLRVS